ncbi:MAG TPA: ATP cone domain-containing protein [Clostridiales bacterium]|nr:ATP cone domain-containing protein [Clostridiales bacterium]HQP68985.1 ATP cone domain-containing protein [Clostridiales bacterium]
MIQVKKANGELEPFSTEKLERSLRNSGADSVLIAEILKEINSWIFEGVTTKRIYDSAFAYLRRKKQSSSIRYKLKQALMELGPTGHPFEHFIGKVMENQGYKTEVALIVRGFCVSHEVDVIATKEKHQLIAECKYGQSSDKSVSVQVPLYVHSRVNDIIRIREKLPEFQGYTFQGMVATNTRFTQDSITYSRCSGLKLLGWDYPEGQGLKDLIDRENIYPITVLQTLTKAQLQLLFDKNIVVCSQILNNIESLDFLRLTPAKQSKLLEEIKSICNK